jgi:hypothetical protein
MSRTPSDPSVPAEASASDLVPGSSPAAQIKIGARLGVWGLVGGLGVMTAGTLGAPLTLGAAIAAMGAGLLISGIGTVVASVGVLRTSVSAPRSVRAAALAGLPLGGVLGLLGLTSLTQWSPLVAVVNALTPTAGVLGLIVIVLLVVALVKEPSSGSAST